MAGAIFDANSGLKTYQRAFESLGISYEELQGLSPEEQMNRVADALANVEDKSTRTALAQDLLGRSGTQLLAAFGDVPGTLADTNAQLSEGAILTKTQIQRIEDFNDTITNLAANIKGFLAQVLPDLLDKFRSIGSYIKDNLNVILPALAGIIGGVLTAKIAAVTVAIYAKVTALIAATAATTGLGAALAVVFSPITLIVGAVALLTAGVVAAYMKFEGFRDVVDSVGRFLRDTVWPILKDTAEVFIAGIGTAFSVVWDVISGIWDVIYALFTGDWKGMWEAVRDTFGGIMEKIGGFFSGLKDKLSETSLLIGIAVLDAISGLINGITSGFSSMVNFVIDLWFTLADKLMGIVHGLVSALGKIPFLGEPFKKAATAIDGMRNSLAALRSEAKVSVPEVDLAGSFGLRSAYTAMTGRETALTSGIPGGPGSGVDTSTLAGIVAASGGGTTTTTTSPADDPEAMERMDTNLARAYAQGRLGELGFTVDDYKNYLRGQMAKAGGSLTDEGSKWYARLQGVEQDQSDVCLLYTSPSPRDS